MSKPDLGNEIERIDSLYKKASSYIDHARQNIQRTVDIEIVKAYWMIGRDIVEEEQLGKDRAGYGRNLLKTLSANLTKKYQRGFSVDTLERARKFYLTYQMDHKQKSAAPLRISENPGEHSVSLVKTPVFSPNLSWGHYLLLIRIKRDDARKFYEIESIKNHWATRELQRQIGSLLFERLSKSKNKEELIKLACHGQELETELKREIKQIEQKKMMDSLIKPD